MVLACACVAIGVLILINYALPDAPIWRGGPVQMSTHPWTAICFVALGTGSFVAGTPGATRTRRVWTIALSMIAMGVVAFRLFTIAIGKPGIFSAISPFSGRLADEITAGRSISMSPQTMVMMTGLIVAVIAVQLRRYALAQLASCLALLIVSAVAIGYAARLPGFFGQLAVPTMTGGLLGGSAILALVAHRAPIRRVLARRSGGSLIRRRLLLAAAPLVLVALIADAFGPQATLEAFPILAALLIGAVVVALIDDTKRSLRNARRQTSAADAPLAAKLTDAWTRGEIFILYQPQIDMSSGRVTGVEALARWQQPGGASVPPTVFIPLAERNGLIVALGRWVLTKACSDIARLPGQLAVSVNVSPIQLTHPGFIDSVRTILAESGLPPQRLVLEITESQLMPEGEAGLHPLAEIHALGVTIAIDDFGTGYSSLSYLNRFPADHLKIDRSFIRELPDDKAAAAITRAIIAMGHSLGMRIIAEGVETSAQADFLQGIWCDAGQGYLYSAPLPASDLPALITA